MMFYLKINKCINGSPVVALCDQDILGYGDGENFKVSDFFYKGDLVGEDQIFKLFEKYTNFNIVGNCIVDLLVENKFLNPNLVIRVGKVKHALVIL